MSRLWAAPGNLTGDASLIRVGAGLAGDEEFACPERSAFKAHPAVRVRAPARFPDEPLEDFALGPVMEVLDRIEFDQESIGDALASVHDPERPIHPVLRSFVEHAVHAYRSGHDDSTARFVPVRDYWVAARKQNGLRWEMYAWGRRYFDPATMIREFRFLRFGTAGDLAREPAQVAIAAYATAWGGVAAWPKPWKEPFRPQERTDVGRVRVVEVGLLNGSRAVLFDGTPGEAQEFFAEHGRRRMASIVAGGPPRPWTVCADCSLLRGCRQPPRAPGLLGVEARGVPLRQVSISDLRYHRRCPAQAHAYSLNLPRAGEYSNQAQMGQAVHARLEALHGRDRRIGCGEADLPPADADWTAGKWSVAGEWAQVGIQMLAGHVEICPLRHAQTIGEVNVEPRLTFYDTAANVIVVAKPDLLYQDLEGGGWVWRETKTTQKSRWYHDDMLEEFPQLALAVMVLARGLLGGDAKTSRVELETLRPGSGDIDLIDPTDPERLAKAQAVLRSYAEPWRRDELFEPRPGSECQRCPVSRWCPSFTG